MEKKTVKKILKYVGIGSGIGLTLYVGNEIRKEYDKTVAENNYLKDFINDHEFYKKTTDKLNDFSKETNSNDIKSRLVKTTERMPDGMIMTTVQDPVSGFKLVSYDDADSKSDLTANCKEM